MSIATPSAPGTSGAPAAAGESAATGPNLVALAKVGRPYGLTGALHLYPYSADAQTLLKAKSLVIGSLSFAVTRSRRSPAARRAMTLAS